MRTFLCVVVAGVLGASVWAQTPPISQQAPARDTQAQQVQKTGTARLAGRVVNAESGSPLRRAQVRASSPEMREGRTVTTDAEGRWEIKALPAGRYSIAVHKGGYVSLSYGQRRPFDQGKTVDVVEGQSVEKLDVSLPKGSVIAGRITDEFGEPISGARVSAMRYRLTGGQRRLTNVGWPGSSDVTDDIGQYRLHGLSPGDYVVSASLSNPISLDVSSDRSGYAATYYPGTDSTAEAQRVTVAVGRESAEISFALIPTRVATISGAATNSAGKPLSNAMIILTTTSAAGESPLAGTTLTRPDGTFSLSNVVPGEYRLETQFLSDLEALASGGVRNMTVAEAASVAITVSGADLTVPVVTAPTSLLTGRLIFDGDVAPSAVPAAFTVVAVPTDPGAVPLGGMAKVRDDWSLEIQGLWGRRLVRAASTVPGWSLKSVVLNGADITDTAIEFKPGEDVSGVQVTLTQRSARISGAVHDARNRPVTDFVVVAFSSDPRRWGYRTRFVRTARPDQGGKFLVSALPPDDYLLVALEYLEPGEEGDPEVLERLRGLATPFTIAEGESKTVSLELARLR